MNPVIVIGLGGTGLEVLMCLRKRIVQRYGELKNLPLLGCLHIDTEQSAKSQAMPNPQYLGENIALEDSERLLLKVQGGNTWKDIEVVREWFPVDLDIPSDFLTGCSAQRNYGRLCFSANVDEICDRLRTLAALVTDPQRLASFGNRYGVTVDTNLDLFFVSSLLGGTGSGMAFDMCYMARDLLQGHNLIFYGYLVTGGPTALNDQKANCYAALMELDHYNKHGFQMGYPAALQPQIKSGQGPVDLMYLVNGINAAGVTFPREVVWESVADNIVAEIVPGIRDLRKALRAQILAAGYTQRDRLEKPQCYFSFGLTSIEFPALNLQDALSYLLAADSLARWPFNQAPKEDQVTLVNRNMEAWRLKAELLEEDLLREQSGISQIQRINETVAAQRADCSKPSALDRKQRSELEARVRTYLRNNDRDVEPRPTAAQSGGRIQQLIQRCDLVKEDIGRSRLQPRVRALVNDPVSGGVGNARAYLEVLEARLQHLSEEFQTREDRYRRAVKEAYEKQQAEFEAFQSDLQESTLVIGKHIDWLFEASARYQQAQVKCAASERGYRLITGWNTTAGEEKGLLTEVQELRDSINKFEAVLGSNAAFCKDQYLKRVASLTQGSGLADVMITDNEIEEIYRRSVPDPLQMAITVKNEIEQTLECDLFQAVLEAPDRTVKALVSAAKEKLGQVRDTSIADRLIGLSPPRRVQKLQDANRNAQVLIQIDRQRRQQYCNIAMPQNVETFLIGTPPPDSEPTLAAGGDLRTTIQGQVAILPQHFAQTLPDRSRLLFAHELGVFSLHSVKDFADYRKIYRTAPTRHRHTHQGIAFADLFPPEETDLHQRVQGAALLGWALELFKEETDPQTQDRAVYYYYLDRHGRHTIRLGADRTAVEGSLFEEQKAKEILARHQNVTPLERLEEHLRQLGGEAKTRPEKQRLWRRLQDYLDAREQALTGGLRHPQHQQESRCINDYRDAYDLTPASGAAAAALAPSEHVPLQGPASITRPPEHRDNVALSPDLEGFRRYVREVVKAEGLNPETWKRMLKQSARYKLGFDDARRVLEEQQRELASESRPLDENRQQYRDAFQALWTATQGHLDDDQRAYLEGLQEELGLTEDQVRDLEAQVTATGNTP